MRSESRSVHTRAIRRCVTCANGRPLAFANSGRKASTGTFLNLKRHCTSSQHEKARAAVITEIEQHPRVWDSSGKEADAARVEVAELLFSARCAGRAELEKPLRADLTPVGAEPGPRTRGSGSAWSSLAPELPEDAQEQLDRTIGRGVFTVNVNQTFAACQRCPRLGRMLIQLSNRNWLANAQTHHATHPDSRGMRTLDFYGVQASKTTSSKRTQGEEVVAARAKRARETALPEGQPQPKPPEVPRAAGKRRATHRPGMR